MSDEFTPPPASNGTPPTMPGSVGTPPPPGGVMRPVLTAQEIDKGKVMAVLVYAVGIVFPLFWIVPLLMRDNRFSLYHAKQGLMHFLVSAVGGAAAGVLMVLLAFITLGIGVCLMPVIWVGSLVFYYVLLIYGIVNAATGQVKPLPIIGRWGESLFSGIDVKPGAA